MKFFRYLILSVTVLQCLCVCVNYAKVLSQNGLSNFYFLTVVKAMLAVLTSPKGVELKSCFRTVAGI